MRRFLLFFALAAAGCLPQTPGQLQQGGFTYHCRSDTDLACADQLFDASDLPPAIAVGADFDLQFSSDGASFVTLDPAAPELLSTESGTGVDTTGFRFLAPGTVDVLARQNGIVVDFADVTGAAIDTLAILGQGGSEIHDVVLSSGIASVTAIPRDDQGQTLAGALVYTWTSSDEEVVSVSQGFDANGAELSPGKPGMATVSVTAGDQQAFITVTVGGTP